MDNGKTSFNKSMHHRATKQQKKIAEFEATESNVPIKGGWLRACRIKCKLCGATLGHEFQHKYDASNVELVCDCGALTVNFNPWASHISGAQGVHLDDDCEEFYEYWDADSSKE